MSTRLGFKPIGSAILGVALCLGTGAYAQDATPAANPQSAGSAASKGGGTTADEFPDLVEISPFGGVSTFGSVNQGLGLKLVDGGVGGVRVAYNPTKWIGLELFGSFSGNNARLLTPNRPGLPAYSWGDRIYNAGFNPIFNLRPRGSRVQPFLTVGVNSSQFTPTHTAKNLA